MAERSKSRLTKSKQSFAEVQARSDSDALLASIVASSDDAILSKTLDGIITSWNAGAERLYGYSEPEVIGNSIMMLVPPERASEIRLILKKIRNGERVVHYKSFRVAKDGHRVEVSITVSPVRDLRGNVVGASTIAREIVEVERVRWALEETASRAHALFQAAAQAIFIVDASGTIAMANPATEAMFGYAADELVGKSIEMLVPDHLRSGHKDKRKGYFASPQTRPMGLGLELQGRRKDGTEFYAEISLSSMQSSQGTLGVAFVTDISKRRSDEQAIRRQREDLRALAGKLMSAEENERRRIARNLHDDLSQTLAHLAIDLGRLASDPAAAEIVKDLRPLQLRATQAAEAVRRISHELHPSVLDDIGLEAALEQYCEDFQLRTGIKTTFAGRNVPEGLKPEVASGIYHITQESLRNVAKHSKADRVSVEAEFADGLLRVTVKDQGIGLEPAGADARRGIGIIGMRERAHIINASLSIDSKAGQGTRVTVAVPLAEVSPDQIRMA